MKIIAFPHPPANLGPGTFQAKFESDLKNRGFGVVYGTKGMKPDLIFIVGGTRRLFWLLKCKFKNIPIVYRLDGINWLHRKKIAERSLKSFILSELTNLMCKILHALYADYIVYQSKFVYDLWLKRGWTKKKKFSIIWNGVDTHLFGPSEEQKNANLKLLCLEGNLDYSPYSITLINELDKVLDINFLVYGGIKFKKERKKLSPKVNYMGFAKPGDLPSIYQNSIYLSLDINPACPNTVIEALACGCPVVGYNTGSLAELVPEEVGEIVPYGSNPWDAKYPDLKNLVKAIAKIRDNYSYYSNNARRIAVERYSIEEMTSKYLRVFDLLIK